MTTSTTSRIASASVLRTASTMRDELASGCRRPIADAGREAARSRPMSALTAAAVASAFEPGRWKMPIAVAFWLLR